MVDYGLTVEDREALHRRREWLVHTYDADLGENPPCILEARVIQKILDGNPADRTTRKMVARRINWLTARIIVAGRKVKDKHRFDAIELRALRKVARVIGVEFDDVS